MEYTRATSAAVVATLLALNVALDVNGVASSVLYASGAPYSYQYHYPYALTYSYNTLPPLVLANHLLQFNVNYDDTSSPSTTATTTAVLDAETSLKDATADDDVSVVVDDDDDDASKSDNGTKSKEISGNQSSAEPPTAIGERASLPDSPLLPSATTESSFLEQTPSTALGELPIPTEESDKLKYYYPSLPVTYSIPKPLAWPTESQFHVQDGFGHYSYGYANEHSSKQEFKLLDGITRGAYNYIDAEGILQTISYVSSDGEGFRVAATNLPHPVVPIEIPDSPEVAAATAAHLQAQFEAMANVNRANNVPAAAGSSANASGDNVVVSGCNETSEVKR